MRFINDATDAGSEQGNWYCIDFDGVLAEQIWPTPGIGAPIANNIAKLRLLAGAGKCLVIFTARPWGDYPALRDWLDRQAIPYDQIVCGKPQAHRYIDDKAVNSEEKSWL